MNGSGGRDGWRQGGPSLDDLPGCEASLVHGHNLFLDLDQGVGLAY